MKWLKKSVLRTVPPEGCESSDSGITGAACQVDAPIDPDCVVTRDLDLSTGGRMVCRADAIGWMQTSIVERRNDDTHLVS
eukprot:3273929-Pyramimonas_sp.AAC.1